GHWQVTRLPRDITERHEKVEYLSTILQKFGAVLPEYDSGSAFPSFMNYPFLVDDREKWVAAFAAVGIRVSPYLADPLHPPDTSCHELNNYRRGSCPNAESISRHILNIPVGRTATLSTLKRLEKLQL